MFDKNGDGMISIDDLIFVMCQLGEKLTETEAKEMIKQGDLDHDGMIDFQGLSVITILIIITIFQNSSTSSKVNDLASQIRFFHSTSSAISTKNLLFSNNNYASKFRKML